jgi:hypothetical protein
VVGAAFVLGNVKAAASVSRAAPSKVTAKGVRKSAKGGKKGKKRCPRCIAVAISNGGGDEEASDSGEECVSATKHDFNC